MKIMKYLLLLTIVSTTLLFNCAVKESIKARELLGKCEYTLTTVDLKLLEFAPVISFDNSTKKFNIERPSIVDLIPMIKKIKNKEFNLHFSQLTFNAHVRIDNPNNHIVVLDSMFFDSYLDSRYLMKITHPEHSDIPAQGSHNTQFVFDVPIEIPFKQILTAENVVLKGKVWLRLKLTENSKITIPIPVTLKRPIPREKINEAIRKQEEKVIQLLLEKLERKAPKNKATKILKSIFK